MSSTKATKKAQPKKSDVPEDQRDWTYLAEKEPTDLHEDMAAWILEVTGYEPESTEDFLKAVQMTAVLRMPYQRSDRNKNRATYRALPAEIVKARSAHMEAAAAEAKAEIEQRKAAADAAKKAAAAKRKASAAKAAATRKTRTAKPNTTPAA